MMQMMLKRRNSGAAAAPPPPVKRQKVAWNCSACSHCHEDELSIHTSCIMCGTNRGTNQLFVLSESKSESTDDIIVRMEKRLQTWYEGMRRYGLEWNGKTTDTQTIDMLTTLSPRAKHFNIHVMDQFIRDIPQLLWWQKILQPYLSLKELSILRCVNTFFEEYWQHVLKQNVIRVPHGCPTIESAMNLAKVFSSPKRNFFKGGCGKVYTKKHPLKIELGEGEHEIMASDTYEDEYGQEVNIIHMRVTCDCITFVGKGKNQTTIRGGVEVHNKKNVRFENLTVTNSSGFGLWFNGYTTVDILKCAVKECMFTGFRVTGGNSTVRDCRFGAVRNMRKDIPPWYSNTKITATQCEFMENGGSGVSCIGSCFENGIQLRLDDCTMHNNVNSGLVAGDGAVVNLHGTKTDIHSNKTYGISAWSRGGKINIHLPSQHNTSHDNVKQNRRQTKDGTIANINTDGTFTHVVLNDDADDDY
jgi:hypothetical protein